MKLFKSLHYAELMLHMPPVLVENQSGGNKVLSYVEGKKIHFQNYTYFTNDMAEISFLRKHKWNGEQYVEVDYNPLTDEEPEKVVLEPKKVMYRGKNDVISELVKVGVSPDELKKMSIENMIKLGKEKYGIEFVEEKLDTKGVDIEIED